MKITRFKVALDGSLAIDPTGNLISFDDYVKLVDNTKKLANIIEKYNHGHYGGSCYCAMCTEGQGALGEIKEMWP